jgi:hypothetical protein
LCEIWKQLEAKLPFSIFIAFLFFSFFFASFTPLLPAQAQYYLRVRLDSVTLNGQSLSVDNPEIRVNTNSTVSGTVTFTVENVQPGSWITPVIWVTSWERGSVADGKVRVVAYDIRSTTQFTGSISIVAPASPGTYYIGFFAGWMYNPDEVASNDHPPLYGDGDDVWDMKQSDWESVVKNGQAPEGAVYRMPGRAIRVIVGVTGELFSLPAGAKSSDPSNPTLHESILLIAINIAGSGQTAYVRPGETVYGTLTYQIWSGAGNPSEINQGFLIMSWTPSWPPPTGYYIPIWNGISGVYPGVKDTKSFSFTAPSSPGTYYLYWCGGAEYGMERAVAWYNRPLTLPAHAKIVVTQPTTVTVTTTVTQTVTTTVTQTTTVTRTTEVTKTITATVTQPATATVTQTVTVTQPTTITQTTTVTQPTFITVTKTETITAPPVTVTTTTTLPPIVITVTSPTFITLTLTHFVTSTETKTLTTTVTTTPPTVTATQTTTMTSLTTITTTVTQPTTVTETKTTTVTTTSATTLPPTTSTVTKTETKEVSRWSEPPVALIAALGMFFASLAAAILIARRRP